MNSIRPAFTAATYTAGVPFPAKRKRYALFFYRVFDLRSDFFLCECKRETLRECEILKNQVWKRDDFEESRSSQSLVISAKEIFPNDSARFRERPVFVGCLYFIIYCRVRAQKADTVIYNSFGIHRASARCLSNFDNALRIQHFKCGLFRCRFFSGPEINLNWMTKDLLRIRRRGVRVEPILETDRTLLSRKSFQKAITVCTRHYHKAGFYIFRVILSTISRKKQNKWEYQLRPMRRWNWIFPRTAASMSFIKSWITFCIEFHVGHALQISHIAYWKNSRLERRRQ